MSNLWYCNVIDGPFYVPALGFARHRTPILTISWTGFYRVGFLVRRERHFGAEGPDFSACREFVTVLFLERQQLFHSWRDHSKCEHERHSYNKPWKLNSTTRSHDHVSAEGRGCLRSCEGYPQAGFYRKWHMEKGSGICSFKLWLVALHYQQHSWHSWYPCRGKGTQDSRSLGIHQTQRPNCLRRRRFGLLADPCCQSSCTSWRKTWWSFYVQGQVRNDCSSTPRTKWIL